MSTANEAGDRSALEALQAKIDKARAAIVTRELDATDVYGVMACPICGKGRLRYEISGPRRHIHARCSTTGCVWWIE